MMEQQWVEETINIVPETMDKVLPQITTLLSQKPLNGQTLVMVVKSLFYGLWNFDKMINQHNLSTKISQLLHKIPKNNSFTFLQQLLNYLHEKWNYIDHHRINKFMQLVRYLLKEAFRIDKTKTQELLKKTIFADVSVRSGLAYHIIELYFQLTLQTVKNFSFSKLTLSEYLLQTHQLEHFRLHLLASVYEKYKQHLFATFAEEPETLEEKLNLLIVRMLEVAKNEPKDGNRKSIYDLVGYLKSDQILMNVYMHEKQMKAEQEKIKKKKKISKHKKQLIREQKQKRKLNKKPKKAKTISRRKFEQQRDDIF